jgi:hypothetical protein
MFVEVCEETRFLENLDNQKSLVFGEWFHDILYTVEG